jgi:DNA polymerase-1
VAEPRQVIDVLALWGDAVDNIPGVPGIGEKTAKILIQKYGTVENLMAHVQELKGKQKENLIAASEHLALSKRLTTIDEQVPINVALEALRIHPYDAPTVQNMLVELEFNQLGKRLFGNDFKAGRGYRAPTNAADDGSAAPAAIALQKMADAPHVYEIASASISIPDAAAIALDLDRNSLGETYVRGVALSWENSRALYMDCTSGVPFCIKNWIESDNKKMGYDLKGQLGIWLDLGYAPAGTWHDVGIAQALAEPEQKNQLAYLAELHFGYILITTEGAATGDLLGLETDEEIHARRQRIQEQADLCWQLHPRLQQRVEQMGQHRVYHEMELPLLPVLASMEHAGIKIAPAAFSALGAELEQQIAGLEVSIQELAGQQFNLNSPRQLGQILFEQMKLVAKPKKTKTGQYVTNEEVLQDLVSAHPIVAQLLEYREASKLKNTYVDALPLAIHAKTGRVHTTYSQVSTATGRLASNHPNLQNIPIRSERGREIRRGFVAGAHDWVLLSADYSQIELRVMAALSGDAAMQEAFQQGEDIHSATAARVFGVMPALVDAEMRRTAKTVNFGIIYGISAFGLAQRLGHSRSDCQRFIDEYFIQYPGVKSYMENTIAQAKSQGYVETLTGRRRYLRDINSANATVRKAAERTAINTPIQGTAADMIKLAMIRAQTAIQKACVSAKMLLQVHDELVFEVPLAELSVLKALVQEAMQGALPLGVPIQIDFGQGYDWKQAHA